MLEEQEQIFETSLLDILGLNGSPEFAGPVRVTNHALRTLAHLVANYGSSSRILKASYYGALNVALQGASGVNVGVLAGGHVKVALFSGTGVAVLGGPMESLRVGGFETMLPAAVGSITLTTTGTATIDLAVMDTILRLTAAVGDLQFWFSVDGTTKSFGPFLLPVGRTRWQNSGPGSWLLLESYPTGTAARALGVENYGVAV